MTRAGHERLKIQVPLLAISIGAWLLLFAGAAGMNLPSFCIPGSLWTPLSEATLQLTLATNPPASLFAGWALMLLAMMAPMLREVVQHVRDRSFRHRQARSIALFIAGYGAVWMATGALLMSIAIVLKLTVPASNWPLIAMLAIAVIWQMSPLKQICLNRCHAKPELAAFGQAADLDALRFGITHGFWCVGSCWAMMSVPLLTVHGHVVTMVLVALWLSGERLDRPQLPKWSFRWPGKAVRLILAQAGTWLPGIRTIRELAPAVGLRTAIGGSQFKERSQKGESIS